MSEVAVVLNLTGNNFDADGERSVKIEVDPNTEGGGADVYTSSDPPIEGLTFSSEPVLDPFEGSTLNIRITDNIDHDPDTKEACLKVQNTMVSDVSVSGSLNNAECKVENGIVVIKTTAQNLDREKDVNLGLITISGGGLSRKVQVVQKKDELQTEKAPLGDKDFNGVDDTGVTFKSFKNTLNNTKTVREFTISISFKAIKMKAYKSGYIEYLTYGSANDTYEFKFAVTNSGWFKITDIKDHYIVFPDELSYEGQLLGRVTSSYLEYKFQSIPRSKVLNIARYSFNGVSVDTSSNKVKDMDDVFEAAYWASGTSSDREGPGTHIESSGYNTNSSSSTTTKEIFLTIKVDTTNTNMNIDRNLKITKYT